MRRVQNSTPITDFGGRKQISFDALFSSDSEEEATVAQPLPVVEHVVPTPASSHVVASPPSPDYPYIREDDPISVWTQKVTESFEKASQSKKQLPPDFKESLGRLSFFRKAPQPQPQPQPQPPPQASIPKEEPSTATVNAQ